MKNGQAVLYVTAGVTPAGRRDITRYSFSVFPHYNKQAIDQLVLVRRKIV